MIARAPFELTANNLTNRCCYVVVGAGGTGMPIAMLLPRILQAGDTVIVVDPDRVEARNVMRQHFTPGDVGQPKADLAALRMRASLPATVAEHVDIVSLVATVQQLGSDFHDTTYPMFAGKRVIVLGSVDNPEARQAIMCTERNSLRGVVVKEWHNLMTYPIPWQAYFDAGNLLRHGQVAMSLISAPMKVAFSTLAQYPKAMASWKRIMGVSTLQNEITASLTFNAMHHFAPSLLTRTEADAAPSCGVRMDDQSCAANNMAAALMFSMLCSYVDGLPISSPYVEFSTVPLLVKGRSFPVPDPAASIERKLNRVGFWPYYPDADRVKELD